MSRVGEIRDEDCESGVKMMKGLLVVRLFSKGCFVDVIVTPFLVEGALVVSCGGAAAGADLADGGIVFSLSFFATCALEGMAGWVVPVIG
jgi:hypothetical protein